MIACGFGKQADIPNREVGHGIALEIAPDHLDRIDVRRVGRKELPVELPPPLEETRDHLGAMGIGAIPHDDERLLDLSAEVLQEPNHPRCRNVGICVEGKVKSYPHPAGRYGKRSYSRNLLMPAPLLNEYRGLPAWRPSPPDQRSHHKPALVDKNDVGVQFAGFFLIRGQSTLIHRWTATSSRSLACRSGFCGLHPIERSSRPI